jgi:DHA2 family multidrug resistance protein
LSSPAPADQDRKPFSGLMLWTIAGTLAMANFVAILDMTVANVALPSIAGSIGITPDQAVWIITSYAVAEAVSVPLTGWLAARFGSVRVMTASMVTFGVFSLLCGLSTSFTLLIFARIVQGWSGGLMMAMSQTLLMRVFPREQIGIAMVAWTMPSLLAPVMGPVIGGWLCQTFSWPLIFYINVPIAAICATLIWRRLKPFESETQRTPVDVVGFALLVTFVGAVQIMLDIGKDHDWFASWEIRTLGIIAALGFASFIIWELTEEHPIVDLRVFRHRGFAAAAMLQAVVFGAAFSGLVLTPLWLQTYMGYTATLAGLTMAWNAVLGFFMAPVAGVLMARWDARVIIFIGLIWIIIAMWMRSTCTTDMTFWQVSIPILLMGGGMPLAFIPLTALGLRSVNEEETASASGLQNFLRTVAGAFAVSIATTAWEYKSTAARSAMAGAVDRGEYAHTTLQSAGMTSDTAIHYIDWMVEAQSAVLGLNHVMIITTAVFMISTGFILLLPKAKGALDLTKMGH